MYAMLMAVAALLASGGNNRPILWALSLVGVLALIIGLGFFFFMRGKVRPVELEDEKKSKKK